MKLLIGIPAYNESVTIGKVIRGIPKEIYGSKNIDVLVVNDGSTDNTEAVARKSGAIVLNHIINRGLGGALKTIFEYAKIMNYEFLVTIDADGQHEGTAIPKLIKPLLNKKDVVIGVRWQDKFHIPFGRFIVNTIANFVTYLLCGIYSQDSQSGMRAFNRRSIRSINLQTDGMEVSSEIFREIKSKNLCFFEVPIKAIYTDYSQTKGQRISDAPEVFFRLILRLVR